MALFTISVAVIKHRLHFFVFLCIALVVRLPHILSDHFVLDGDEAIVGLMMRAFLEGNGLDAFFWGQNYGLVLPELLVSAPFAVLFDLNDFTFKLPQLLWFTLGSYFIFLTIKKKASTQWAWLLILLFLVCSTWYIWGLRVRGGYGFSFALTHLVIYYSLTKSVWKSWQWMLLGFGIGGVFTAQQLWFPAAFVFGCAAIASNYRSFKQIGYVLFGMLFGTAPWLFHYEANAFYQPATLSFDPQVIAFNASVYWSFLVRGFNGLYLHGSAFTDLSSINFYAVFMTLAFFVLWGVLVFRLKNESRNYFYWAAFLSLGSIGFGAFFLGSAAPRYALPLIGYMWVSMSIVFGTYQIPVLLSRVLSGLVIALLILSLYATSQMRSMHYEDMTRTDFNKLLADLEKHEVTMVFTGNYMLQWQIMYYSEEMIPARSVHIRERVPRLYNEAINTYKENPDRIALIDFTWDASEVVKYDVQNDVFSVLFAPSQNTLEELGYKGLEQ